MVVGEMVNMLRGWYIMLLRQKPSFKDGLARPKRGKPIYVSTTRCDFLKRDKDFVSVEFRIFLFKSQKPVLSLSCLVYVANFVSLFLQRERP